MSGVVRLVLAAALAAVAAGVGCGSAQVTITFDYDWSAEEDAEFPTDSESESASFSRLVCATHDEHYVLWENDELPTAGVKSLVADEPVSEPILDGLRRARAAGSVGDFGEGEQELVKPVGSETFNLTLSGSFTFISCIAAIIPSPDWFVGVSGVAMCNEASRKFNDSEEIVVLTGWDAGTDDGESYLSEKLPAVPTKPIQLLVGLAQRYGKASFVVNSNRNKTTADAVACFPGDEYVMLYDGSELPMRALTTRHRVRVPGAAPAAAGSPVFMFSHHDPAAWTRFVKLSFRAVNGDAASLRVSPGHFVYVRDAAGGGALRLVAADTIRAGRAALVAADGAVLPVLAVESVMARGLYNPHPLAGDLVVSGVRVSSYTRAVAPAVAATALVPLRALYRAGFASSVDAVGTFLLSGPWNDCLARFVPGSLGGILAT